MKEFLFLKTWKFYRKFKMLHNNIFMIRLYSDHPWRNHYFARQHVQTLLLRFRCCWIMIYGLMCYLKQTKTRKTFPHQFFCHMHLSFERRVVMFRVIFQVFTNMLLHSMHCILITRLPNVLENMEMFFAL